MHPISAPTRIASIALLIAAGVGCTLGGQEGEDMETRTDGYGTTVGSSTTTGTGSSGWSWGTGSGSGSGGTSPTAGDSDDALGVPGDTGDTGDTGTATGTPQCGAQLPRLYLSPDDSNSYASAVLSPARVAVGRAPRAVRTYEIFNYYDFAVPPGPAGGVSLTAEWLEDGLGPEDYALQVMVGAESMAPSARAPMNLTLVLDTSGSMSGQPIAMLRESCEAIAASLRHGDVVSMVTWDTSQTAVLSGQPVTGPSDPVVTGACGSLTAGGGTDLHAGLTAGYALAQANMAPGRVNRVVLVSDGGANVGITDERMIGQEAASADDSGIFLVGIGVGGIDYNDLLMDTVTDAGRGASVFVDDADEAWTMLHDRFLEVFGVAATDVRLELQLPERLRVVSTSAEEISVNPAQVQPQYLAPNGEMVFYNELATPIDVCLTDDSEIQARVTFTDPSGQARFVDQTFRIGDLRNGSRANALKGRALYLYAEALKARSLGWPHQDQTVTDALIALDEADLAWPGDPDLAEVRGVLNQL